MVETDAMEAMPPWLALKWSGPLYTFQSHEIFMVVYLSPSSTQQLGGGKGGRAMAVPAGWCLEGGPCAPLP